MRLFLIIVALISILGPAAANAQSGDASTQTLQAEQKSERLRSLFQEIIEETEARIQKQAETLAASQDEVARLTKDLASAQQEAARLTAALEKAEAAAGDVARIRAEARQQIEALTSLPC